MGATYIAVRGGGGNHDRGPGSAGISISVNELASVNRGQEAGKRDELHESHLGWLRWWTKRWSWEKGEGLLCAWNQI